MFYRDAFTLWLQQQRPDAPPRVYQPGGFMGAPAVGWDVHIGHTRFVYRVPSESPEIFYIVLIERGAATRTLRSPFADLVRLLQLIQRSSAGIRWIRGHVEPVKHRPGDALPRERILAFYQRYLTAVSTGVENGVEWYGGDLTAFSWNAEKRKIRARPSEPTALAARLT